MANNGMPEEFRSKLYVMSTNGEPLYDLQPEMTEYFLQFGRVLLLKVVNKELSWAYVIFGSPEDADEALDYCSPGIVIAGIPMEVKPWQPTDDRAGVEAAEIRQLQQAFSVTPASKNVDIIDVNVPKISAPDQPIKFSLRIKNKILAPRVFKGVRQVNFWKESEVKDNLPRRATKATPLTIQGQKTHEVEIIFRPSLVGVFHLIFIFEFDFGSKAHEVVVRVEDRDVQALRSKTDWVDRDVDFFERSVIPAIHDGKVSKRSRYIPSESQKENLPAYDVPKKIQADVDELGRSRSFNPWKVRDNWKSRLHELLYVEEAEQRKQMRRYDLYEQTFENVRSFLKGTVTVFVDPSEPLIRIRVPGLAEKRPSILAGDQVYVWLPNTFDIEWEGFVQHVETESILCFFAPDFHQNVFSDRLKFNVRFAFNRLPLRLMHRAVDKVDLNVIWPSDETQQSVIGAVTKIQFKKQDLVFIDRRINDNPEQQEAVYHAVNRSSQPSLKLPFMLLGPFGTGKTAVMIEIVKQILRLIPQSRILICAPSNSAADVFAVKLSNFEDFQSTGSTIVGGVKPGAKNTAPTNTPPKMLRLYPASRPREAVPSEVLPFTVWNDALGSFDTPTADQLKSYRVVVTTCNSASILYNSGIPQGFFTHIAVDEAAQLMEPEVLIPLSLAALGKTAVILAGDPKQLGPRLQSGFVRQQQLTASIMERLCSVPVYQEAQRFDMLVRLNKNYRSHSAILEFPSKRFYGGVLQAKLEKTKADRFVDWTRLKNRSSPVLFVGTEGEDMREADSPSFYNPQEVVQIGKFVQDLLRDPLISPPLRASEVGVVTPFYKQSQKIRQYLRQRDMGDVFVGSVDECQGKEFAALFISTVRASRRWHETYDNVFGVGFLDDEKMMNTAMTRAVGLLVVIGDPYVLSMDENWREFMSYCSIKGNYLGPEMTPAYQKEREQREQQIKVPEFKPVPEAAAGEYFSAEEDDSSVSTSETGSVAEIVAPSSGGSSKKKKKKKNKKNSAQAPVGPSAVQSQTDPVMEEPDYEAMDANLDVGLDDLEGDIEEAFADDVLDNPHHNPSSVYDMTQTESAANPLFALLQQQQQQQSTGQAPNTLGFLSQYLRLSQLHHHQQQQQQQQQQVSSQQQGWVAVYRWRNAFELILLPEGTQPPPFNIYDRGTVVDIEIGKFNLIVSAQKNGDVIFLQLSPAEPAPGALVFYQPNPASIMIRVPVSEFDASLAVVVENQSHVIVRLSRSASPQWQPVAILPSPDPESRIV